MKVHNVKQRNVVVKVLLTLIVLFTPFQIVCAQPLPTENPHNQLTPVSLQFNWHHQFEYAGFYAAIKQGYYQQAGLKVDIKSWQPSEQVIANLVNGKVDFGVAYGTALANFIKGASIKLVMPNFQYSPIVFLSHKPINQWEDLNGKVVVDQKNLYLKDMLVKLKAGSQYPSKVKYTPISGNLQDFIDGKIDLYGAYQTNEPYRLKQLGVQFHIIDPKSYGVQGYGDLLLTSSAFAKSSPDVVYRFKEATIKGWRYALRHQREMVDYIIVHYPVTKTREDLLDEAQKTGFYVRTPKHEIGDIDPAKLLVMATESEETGLISRKEMESFKPSAFIFNRGLSLTPEELAYIQKHPVVRLGNDIDWRPFEYIDSQGPYQGISADYFKLLGEKLGLQFKPVKHKNWSQVVELAKQGKIDVFSCAVASPERQQYMRFTQPYLSFPMVYVSKNALSLIHSYDDFKGKTVAVVKDYWADEYIQQKYRMVKRLQVKDVRQGLEAVLDGRADIYVGNLGVINYTLKHYGLTGLSIVGQSNRRFELAIGVQKDNPVLLSILEKGLSAITEQQKHEIYNRWINIEMVKRLDKRQLISLGTIAGVVLFGLVGLILIYRYQKNKQQAYINQIHELTYASMIDLSNFHLVKVSDAYADLTGYSKKELLGMNYPALASDSVTDEQKAYVVQQLSSGKSWHGEIEGKNKQGENYWVMLTLTPIKNFWGKVTHVWATRINITDKKRIESLSITDDMTGLYNRRYFNQIIEQEINRAKRQGQSLAVAMLDIDYFKKINDTYGHQAGDDVLMKVAQRFKACFSRANDFVFRMGGEEFLIISSFETEAEFRGYLEKCCRDIESLNIINEGSKFGVLTVSIGAVFLDAEKISNSMILYHLVDKKLYEAKEGGRNRVVM